ncbi:MAG: sigma-70 family RNA polymerase sigma factor [Ilumatobacter sp.]
MSTAPPVEHLDDLELFREFVRTKQRRVRNQLVERHMGLAAHITKRYSRTGRNDDDLRQVAMVGLVRAVDRFDPEFGVAFSTFAGTTIEGELKRHFRDASWSVKVPRSAKELHLLVRRAAAELEQQRGISPTVDDIAKHLELSRDDVLRGLAASAAASVGTIDGGADDDLSSGRQAVLADDVDAFEHAENVSLLGPLIADLPVRQQEIIRLRFFEERSQSEIAETIGVSQMHVSRLLKRSFETMRAAMGDVDSEWLER